MLAMEAHQPRIGGKKTLTTVKKYSIRLFFGLQSLKHLFFYVGNGQVKDFDNRKKTLNRVFVLET
jgi:hypothetical protein